MRASNLRSEMLLLLSALLCFPLVLSSIAPAAATIKGPNGEACNSSATGVKHDIKGQSHTCDKCVILKCDSSGTQVSNCTSTTHWSNCVAALVRPGVPLQSTTGQTRSPSSEKPTAPPQKTGVSGKQEGTAR